MKVLLVAVLGFSAAFFQAPQKQHLTKKSETVSPYETTKIHLTQLRLELRRRRITDTMQLQQYFVHCIIDSLIPYWYGTPWDFNGTTQVPRKGAIACGYFVSTVLRDAGLPVNRVAMGQSSSEKMTYALAEKKDIKLFYNKPLDTALHYINSKGTGLYIIGLDCHVGFMLNDGTNIWFIHSKWFDEKAVVKELAATSSVLYYSKYRMIGKISNNKALLLKWVNE